VNRELCRYDRDSGEWVTSQRLITGQFERYSERWPREGGLRSSRCHSRTTAFPFLSGKEGWQLFPTPTCDPDRNLTSKALFRTCSGTARVLREDGRTSLAGLSATLGGRVSCGFAEWLMGWPKGWSSRHPLYTDDLSSWRSQHAPSTTARMEDEDVRAG
jgi:hypothetical protein